MKSGLDRPIAKIVTVLTGASTDSVTLATAFAAARLLGAHVRAVFVQPAPEKSIPDIGLAASPASFEQLIETACEMASEAGKSARQSLAIQAERCKVRVVSIARCEPGATAAYVPSCGAITECLAKEAPVCDLFVLPPLRAMNEDLQKAFANVLLETGRPVLLSPLQPPEHVGERVALAWDNSLPAGHALSAALPFLSRAESVEIIAVRDKRDVRELTAPAVEYLSLHGIGCTEHLMEQGKLRAGDVILERVASSACDLLVAGGYGHGRLRETIFGGVTERLTSHATVPLLMMH